MFSDPTLALERVDDKHWMLLRALYYEGQTELFKVPAGYKTDLASVPRVLQWFAPSSGQYTLAAVLHDHLCDRVANGLMSSHDADGLFRRVMAEEGVPVALRWLMWAGVRWGSVFNRNRRKSTLRDMPVVLLWTLLAAPMVLPALVFILLGLGVYYIVEFIAESFE